MLLVLNVPRSATRTYAWGKAEIVVGSRHNTWLMGCRWGSKPSTYALEPYMGRYLWFRKMIFQPFELTIAPTFVRLHYAKIIYIIYSANLSIEKLFANVVVIANVIG